MVPKASQWVLKDFERNWSKLVDRVGVFYYIHYIFVDDLNFKLLYFFGKRCWGTVEKEVGNHCSGRPLIAFIAFRTHLSQRDNVSVHTFYEVCTVDT